MQDEALSKFQAELDKATEKKDEGTDMEPPDDSRQLRNQFNFSERAAQTFNNPLRERGTSTEPPPTANMSGNPTQMVDKELHQNLVSEEINSWVPTGSCSQWEIYDEYILDLERQKLQEEINKQKAAAKKGGGPPAAASVEVHDDQENKRPSGGSKLHGDEMKKAVKVIERMVNQNTFDEISMDFKYWNDTSDSIRWVYVYS